MPTEVLVDILREHQRSPWQALRPFSWRGGPVGVVTIYDYDMPRRTGMTWDTVKGWSELDWNNHAHVINCPADGMCVRAQDNGAPGYLGVLHTLLRSGSVVPSRCLDDWLAADEGLTSRQLCAPELRLFYRNDL